MSTRSILSIAYAIHCLEDMGLDTQPVLSKYGFSLEQLDPFGQIERATELKIMTELLPQMEDPLCGLELGQKFSLVGYGPFSLMLLTAPNAFEATRVGVHFQDITYLYGRLELDLAAINSALDIYPLPLPESIRSQLIDRDIAGTYQLFKDIIKIIEEEVELQEVWIPHEHFGQAETYETLFQCPVKFNKPHSRMVIKSVDLSRPFPGANPIAFKLYKEQCNHLLSMRHSLTNRLAEKVNQYLELFENEFPKVEDVATLFAISERTLRRQLKSENSSFQKILNDVRFQKSKHFLSTTLMPVDMIAYKLGYSEPASFNHAFTRWAGISPTQFRQQSIATKK